ncbi:sugar phosphate nucleotidyltransferase [Streptomyces caniscabiei]|uniref:sugar phosphate nucleotidyltransferase n=1 Tax=Streptomyces caniscabiei TaxID=2746961 RepID=UPI0029A043B7|nr:sugar phosphate nucleotidyltransferase [Streptomyces caniscabiei]MDX2776664.1 sugar phosphate nucleotidyltransferase [Streptomyces caniscabiei]
MQRKRVAIILAGGGGTRLWPLSDRNHPKPLIELFNHQSMLEQTLFRAELCTDASFILTSKNALQRIESSLEKLAVPSSHVIIEPEGADTAAAIAYALARVKARYGDETSIVLMAVDHRIKNHGAFYRDMRYAFSAAEQYNAIVLFGITPTYAATGYGYIQLGTSLEHHDRNVLFNVDTFMEKPSKEKAETLSKSPDHVWNSGIFVGTINAFETAFKYNASLYRWYQDISTNPSTPMPVTFRHFQFEHEILEHTRSLLVTTATFDWADIGTFTGLHATLPELDGNGNVIRGNVKISDSHDCLVIGNHKKIIILGLDDIAVVDGPDGILVCRKSTHSQLVGTLATGKEQPGAKQ